MNTHSFRGPGDDWDPQGYDDSAENAEELNKLGMHTEEEKKEEEEVVKADEEEAIDEKKADEDEEEEEVEDVDDLKELDRLEKKLKEESLGMGDTDEE